MRLEFTLIVAGILIILLISLINLVFILRENRQNIQGAAKDLKDKVRAYLDIVPLMMFKSGNQDKKIYKERAEWYENWNNTDKHWKIWSELMPTLSKIEIEDDTLKVHIQEAELNVHESVHTYNEQVIKLNNRLKKFRYKTARTLYLGGKVRRRKILEDQAI